MAGVNCLFVRCKLCANKAESDVGRRLSHTTLVVGDVVRSSAII